MPNTGQWKKVSGKISIETLTRGGSKTILCLHYIKLPISHHIMQ